MLTVSGPCVFVGHKAHEVTPVNSSSHDGAQSPGWPGHLSTVTQLRGRAGVHPDTPLISFTGPSSFYLSQTEHQCPGRRSQTPSLPDRVSASPAVHDQGVPCLARIGYTVRDQPDSPVLLRTTSSAGLPKAGSAGGMTVVDG